MNNWCVKRFHRVMTFSLIIRCCAFTFWLFAQWLGTLLLSILTSLSNHFEDLLVSVCLPTALLMNVLLPCFCMLNFSTHSSHGCAMRSAGILQSLHFRSSYTVNRLCLVYGSRLTALRDPMAMERANLLNMAKLSIKGLIESALSFGRTLDSDYPPLQQFFVVMEHCLKHGLRGEWLRGF